MAFRFRKSIGFGLGRINLSKRGASLSVGGRGNVLNFSRNGVRQTVGIPGTGMSWSTKICGGSSSRRQVAEDEIGDRMELAEATLAINKAQVHAMELAFAEAEKLVPQMTEEQLAEHEIWRAKLEQHRVVIAQEERSRTRIKQMLFEGKAKRILKGILFFAVLFWLAGKVGGYLDEKSPNRRQPQIPVVPVVEQMAPPTSTEVPLPRPRPRQQVQH